MPKYKATFKLSRIDDDNSFIEHEVGGFHVPNSTLSKITELVALLTKSAEELEPDSEGGKE